ncbi:tryptophan synthase subunit beta [Priestia endophytica]|uniref:tryptophan synthase subunit beta n=1 Tax=Priestia endophytica TaxID=135735 RepID=UPI00227FDEEB|nr:tryptophan synthase subunit beta [Priestia endophytica]MCY8232740.1 tryptophan synthase subunit beta [Priestia endophytica]
MKYSYPDSFGRFGEYGGKYVPETLMYPLEQLEEALDKAMEDENFKEEYANLLKEYSGRPTALTYADQVTKKLGGAKIYLKREDLNHTGAHKINNALGQALLAKYMGKTKLIAETGAGQHGVATATVAAKFGMECKVFMGEEDIERQKLNVFRMKLLGAEVIPVSSGTKTLKDATSEAIRFWVSHCEDHFYLLGSATGPHPYPKMVRDFQKIIGIEAKKQFMEKEGRLPHTVIACVGGGSNAIGMFYDFIGDEDVKLIGVEAGGKGLDSGLHSAKMARGSKGVLHGTLTNLLQDEHGQITEPYSISAGLDYPGVGPEHALLSSINRVEYKSATDREALDAFTLLTKTEGIMPAIESSHALAEAFRLAPLKSKDETILVCLSGRGDKDVNSLIRLLEEEMDNDHVQRETTKA